MPLSRIVNKNKVFAKRRSFPLSEDSERRKIFSVGQIVAMENKAAYFKAVKIYEIDLTKSKKKNTIDA